MNYSIVSKIAQSKGTAELLLLIINATSYDERITWLKQGILHFAVGRFNNKTATALARSFLESLTKSGHYINEKEVSKFFGKRRFRVGASGKERLEALSPLLNTAAIRSNMNLVGTLLYTPVIKCHLIENTLIYAIRSGNLELTHLLLDFGASCNTVGDYGTPYS